MLSRCWMLLWVLVPAFTRAEISSDRVYRKGYGQRLGAVPQALGGEDYPDEGEVIPSFAEPVQNITVPRGRDAKIACIIDNLGDFRPAWIKEKDKAILTMHQQIISRNYRISLSTSDNRVFTLHIRNVQESDRGGYMCQINTSPVKSSTGYLDVLDGKYFTEEVLRPKELTNKASGALRSVSSAVITLPCVLVALLNIS